MRMRERGQRASFAAEPSEVLFAGEIGVDDLECDVALEATVVGAKDLAHPAAAERLEDVVRTQPHAAPYRRHRVSPDGECAICRAIIRAFAWYSPAICGPWLDCARENRPGGSWC